MQSFQNIAEQLFDRIHRPDLACRWASPTFLRNVSWILNRTSSGRVIRHTTTHSSDPSQNGILDDHVHANSKTPRTEQKMVGSLAKTGFPHRKDNLGQSNVLKAPLSNSNCSFCHFYVSRQDNFASSKKCPRTSIDDCDIKTPFCVRKENLLRRRAAAHLTE